VLKENTVIIGTGDHRQHRHRLAFVAAAKGYQLILTIADTLPCTLAERLQRPLLGHYA